jgi:hypothetical protein
VIDDARVLGALPAGPRAAHVVPVCFHALGMTGRSRVTVEPTEVWWIAGSDTTAKLEVPISMLGGKVEIMAIPYVDPHARELGLRLPVTGTATVQPQRAVGSGELCGVVTADGRELLLVATTGAARGEPVAAVPIQEAPPGFLRAYFPRFDRLMRRLPILVQV